MNAASTSILASTLLLFSGCSQASQPAQKDSGKSVVEPAAILLMADGIAQGKEANFPYGSAQDILVAELEKSGPVNILTNEECGAGPMEFAASPATGLTLNFQESRFTGWFYDGDGQSARTAEDISTGSSRAALEQAMPIAMQPDSTLGVEFFSSSGEGVFIGGFLSDDSDNAVVNSLYSGTNCFFR